MNPDIALFHWFNDLAGTSAWLDWTVRALVNDYAVPTLMVLILGSMWLTGANEEERRTNQRAVLFAILGLMLVNILIRLMQEVYFRPRPFATEPVKLLFYRPSVSSFPSEPVATMFCFVTALWRANRTAGRILLSLAVAFGLARLIAGVHYPSDLIGGACFGIICTWLPMKYSRIFDRPLGSLLQLGRRFNLA